MKGYRLPGFMLIIGFNLSRRWDQEPGKGPRDTPECRPSVNPSMEAQRRRCVSDGLAGLHPIPSVPHSEN